jgi:beta-glucanase (GH16 family)
MRLALASGATVLAALSGCSSSGDSSPPGATSDDASSGDDATFDAGRGSETGGGGGDATAGDGGSADATDDRTIPGWILTWSDEFDGADGSPVDPVRWSHDVGGSGWGNQEREYYTDGAQNAVQQGGNLVITATTQGASQYTCWYGTCEYTSARLLTKGHFAQAYGRFEARAQMPFGKGLWPAFWMLGDNIDQVNWPACGEIDILETVGTDISTNHGSLHAPNMNPTGTFPLPNGAKYSDAFHTFAVEWEPGVVRFYVDDQLYETQTQAGQDAGTWEFDHPFFLLLNVAVGGQWPGDPDATTTFPQTLKVDWVRVYQKSGTEP